MKAGRAFLQRQSLGTMSWRLGLQDIIMNGGVGERLKPAVLKTVRLERASGVRIPPPPPDERIVVVG